MSINKKIFLFTCLIIAAFVLPGIINEILAGFPGHENIKAPIISPSDAHKILEVAPSGEMTSQAAELTELAKGLKNDPDLIYEMYITYCSLAADDIRKTIKKIMNCRKTTIDLKRHSFCGQVQQMVRPSCSSCSCRAIFRAFPIR